MPKVSRLLQILAFLQVEPQTTMSIKKKMGIGSIQAIQLLHQLEDAGLAQTSKLDGKRLVWVYKPTGWSTLRGGYIGR